MSIKLFTKAVIRLILNYIQTEMIIEDLYNILVRIFHIL
jgi:hypothetical protein